MRVRRPLAVLCAIAPLAVAASACSDTSAGNITGTRGRTIVRITNPLHDTCHRFGPIGVDRVVNNTGVDVELHKALDCSDPAGRPAFYLAATTSASAVVSQGLWKSFTTVGWPPPVPPNVPTSRQVAVIR